MLSSRRELTRRTCRPRLVEGQTQKPQQEAAAVHFPARELQRDSPTPVTRTQPHSQEVKRFQGGHLLKHQSLALTQVLLPLPQALDITLQANRHRQDIVQHFHLARPVASRRCRRSPRPTPKRPSTPSSSTVSTRSRSSYHTPGSGPSTEYTTAQLYTSEAPSMIGTVVTQYPALPSSRTSSVRTPSLYEDSITPSHVEELPPSTLSRQLSLYSAAESSVPGSPPTIPSEERLHPRRVSPLDPRHHPDRPRQTPSTVITPVPSFMTPSSMATVPDQPSSVSSLSLPSMPGSSTEVSTVLSTTVSSLPSGPRTLPTRASTSMYYVSETDASFDSSVLAGTPSSRSVQIPEGPDVSYDTSFLRPSRGYESSEAQSFLPSISIISRSPSSVSTASGVSMSSSKLDNRSLFDFPTRTVRAVTSDSRFILIVSRQRLLAFLSRLLPPLLMSLLVSV